MKSISEQIRAKEFHWPDFKLVTHMGQTAVWEGELAPDKRRHLVRVQYRAPLAIENLTVLQVQPRVQVINPKLERHLDFDEGPIPHVYVNDNDRSLPYLCLFDPTAREWDVADLIAQTTIFWTWEWLYFYEAWLVTRKWQGGGRHYQQADGEKRLATV
jgi:hypothetical protein